MFYRSVRALSLGALAAFGLAGCATPNAGDSTRQATASDSAYGNPDHWLCRPGRQDACAADLSATVVMADGTLAHEDWQRNPQAPIDCFYVYPTVSRDPSGNSDMNAGEEERHVVQQQFARFGSVCRTFAPVYRQITLAGLRSRFIGEPIPMDWSLAYGDVRAAWQHYLEHDNNGRGVVLIGHSQGARALTQLLREEIEGKPAQSRLVSALLIGTGVMVPKGKDVGGSFQHTSLCRAGDQIGCVIAYVAFRATNPPPAKSLFGLGKDGQMVACTNPAALSGGSGQLQAYLPNKLNMLGLPVEQDPWVEPVQPIDTPFVRVPGLLSAECATGSNDSSYLAVKVQADPNDPRTDDIAGELIYNGMALQNWGLHLIDVNLAQGDLIDIVEQQSRAYRASGR